MGIVGMAPLWQNFPISIGLIPDTLWLSDSVNSSCPDGDSSLWPSDRKASNSITWMVIFNVSLAQQSVRKESYEEYISALLNDLWTKQETVKSMNYLKSLKSKSLANQRYRF